MVASYEADAQVAYLVQNGLADVVISDDSDCLPYLCKMVIHIHPWAYQAATLYWNTLTGIVQIG